MSKANLVEIGSIKMPSWIMFLLALNQTFPDEKMLSALGSVPKEARTEPQE
jgi:hypothetical protein|tara:strand:- start:521 stop:673 length:153 start_codon:yes stop_codon:yes gene_type:complete